MLCHFEQLHYPGVSKFAITSSSKVVSNVADDRLDYNLFPQPPIRTHFDSPHTIHIVKKSSRAGDSVSENNESSIAILTFLPSHLFIVPKAVLYLYTQLEDLDPFFPNSCSGSYGHQKLHVESIVPDNFENNFWILSNLQDHRLDLLFQEKRGIASSSLPGAFTLLRITSLDTFYPNIPLVLTCALRAEFATLFQAHTIKNNAPTFSLPVSLLHLLPDTESLQGSKRVTLGLLGFVPLKSRSVLGTQVSSSQSFLETILSSSQLHECARVFGKLKNDADYFSRNDCISALELSPQHLLVGVPQFVAFLSSHFSRTKASLSVILTSAFPFETRSLTGFHITTNSLLGPLFSTSKSRANMNSSSDAYCSFHLSAVVENGVLEHFSQKCHYSAESAVDSLKCVFATPIVFASPNLPRSAMDTKSFSAHIMCDDVFLSDSLYRLPASSLLRTLAGEENLRSNYGSLLLMTVTTTVVDDAVNGTASSLLFAAPLSLHGFMSDAHTVTFGASLWRPFPSILLSDNNNKEDKGFFQKTTVDKSSLLQSQDGISTINMVISPLRDTLSTLVSDDLEHLYIHVSFLVPQVQASENFLNRYLDLDLTFARCYLHSPPKSHFGAFSMHEYLASDLPFQSHVPNAHAPHTTSPFNMHLEPIESPLTALRIEQVNLDDDENLVDDISAPLHHILHLSSRIPVEHIRALFYSMDSTKPLESLLFSCSDTSRYSLFFLLDTMLQFSLSKRAEPSSHILTPFLLTPVSPSLSDNESNDESNDESNNESENKSQNKAKDELFTFRSRIQHHHYVPNRIVSMSHDEGDVQSSTFLASLWKAHPKRPVLSVILGSTGINGDDVRFRERISLSGDGLGQALDIQVHLAGSSLALSDLSRSTRIFSQRSGLLTVTVVRFNTTHDYVMDGIPSSHRFWSHDVSTPLGLRIVSGGIDSSSEWFWDALPAHGLSSIPLPWNPLRDSENNTVKSVIDGSLIHRVSLVFTAFLEGNPVTRTILGPVDYTFGLKTFIPSCPFNLNQFGSENVIATWEEGGGVDDEETDSSLGYIHRRLLYSCPEGFELRGPSFSVCSSFVDGTRGSDANLQTMSVTLLPNPRQTHCVQVKTTECLGSLGLTSLVSDLNPKASYPIGAATKVQCDPKISSTVLLGEPTATCKFSSNSNTSNWVSSAGCYNTSSLCRIDVAATLRPLNLDIISFNSSRFSVHDMVVSDINQASYILLPKNSIHPLQCQSGFVSVQDFSINESVISCSAQGVVSLLPGTHCVPLQMQYCEPREFLLDHDLEQDDTLTSFSFPLLSTFPLHKALKKCNENVGTTALNDNIDNLFTILEQTIHPKCIYDYHNSRVKWTLTFKEVCGILRQAQEFVSLQISKRETIPVPKCLVTSHPQFSLLSLSDPIIRENEENIILQAECPQGLYIIDPKFNNDSTFKTKSAFMEKHNSVDSFTCRFMLHDENGVETIQSAWVNDNGTLLSNIRCVKTMCSALPSQWQESGTLAYSLPDSLFSFSPSQRFETSLGRISIPRFPTHTRALFTLAHSQAQVSNSRLYLSISSIPQSTSSLSMVCQEDGNWSIDPQTITIDSVDTTCVLKDLISSLVEFELVLGPSKVGYSSFQSLPLGVTFTFDELVCLDRTEKVHHFPSYVAKVPVTGTAEGDVVSAYEIAVRKGTTKESGEFLFYQPALLSSHISIQCTSFGWRVFDSSSAKRGTVFAPTLENTHPVSSLRCLKKDKSCFIPHSHVFSVAKVEIGYSIGTGQFFPLGNSFDLHDLLSPGVYSLRFEAGELVETSCSAGAWNFPSLVIDDPLAADSYVNLSAVEAALVIARLASKFASQLTHSESIPLVVHTKKSLKDLFFESEFSSLPDFLFFNSPLVTKQPLHCKSSQVLPAGAVIEYRITPSSIEKAPQTYGVYINGFSIDQARNYAFSANTNSVPCAPLFCATPAVDDDTVFFQSFPVMQTSTQWHEEGAVLSLQCRLPRGRDSKSMPRKIVSTGMIEYLQNIDTLLQRANLNESNTFDSSVNTTFNFSTIPSTWFANLLSEDNVSLQCKNGLWRTISSTGMAYSPLPMEHVYSYTYERSNNEPTTKIGFDHLTCTEYFNSRMISDDAIVRIPQISVIPISSNDIQNNLLESASLAWVVSTSMASSLSVTVLPVNSTRYKMENQTSYSAIRNSTRVYLYIIGLASLTGTAPIFESINNHDSTVFLPDNSSSSSCMTTSLSNIISPTATLSGTSLSSLSKTIPSLDLCGTNAAQTTLRSFCPVSELFKTDEQVENEDRTIPVLYNPLTEALSEGWSVAEGTSLLLTCIHESGYAIWPRTTHEIVSTNVRCEHGLWNNPVHRCVPFQSIVASTLCEIDETTQVQKVVTQIKTQSQSSLSPSALRFRSNGVLMEEFTRMEIPCSDFVDFNTTAVHFNITQAAPAFLIDITVLRCFMTKEKFSMLMSIEYDPNIATKDRSTTLQTSSSHLCELSPTWVFPEPIALNTSSEYWKPRTMFLSGSILNSSPFLHLPFITALNSSPPAFFTVQATPNISITNLCNNLPVSITFNIQNTPGNDDVAIYPLHIDLVVNETTDPLIISLLRPALLTQGEVASSGLFEIFFNGSELLSKFKGNFTIPITFAIQSTKLTQLYDMNMVKSARQHSFAFQTVSVEITIEAPYLELVLHDISQALVRAPLGPSKTIITYPGLFLSLEHVFVGVEYNQNCPTLEAELSVQWEMRNNSTVIPQGLSSSYSVRPIVTVLHSLASLLPQMPGALAMTVKATTAEHRYKRENANNTLRDTNFAAIYNESDDAILENDLPDSFKFDTFAVLVSQAELNFAPFPNLDLHWNFYYPIDFISDVHLRQAQINVEKTAFFLTFTDFTLDENFLKDLRQTSEFSPEVSYEVLVEQALEKIRDIIHTNHFPNSQAVFIKPDILLSLLTAGLGSFVIQAQGYTFFDEKMMFFEASSIVRMDFIFRPQLKPLLSTDDIPPPSTDMVLYHLPDDRNAFHTHSFTLYADSIETATGLIFTSRFRLKIYDIYLTSKGFDVTGSHQVLRFLIPQVVDGVPGITIREIQTVGERAFFDPYIIPTLPGELSTVTFEIWNILPEYKDTPEHFFLAYSAKIFIFSIPQASFYHVVLPSSGTVLSPNPNYSYRDELIAFEFRLKDLYQAEVPPAQVLWAMSLGPESVILAFTKYIETHDMKNTLFLSFDHLAMKSIFSTISPGVSIQFVVEATVIFFNRTAFDLSFSFTFTSIPALPIELRALGGGKDAQLQILIENPASMVFSYRVLNLYELITLTATLSSESVANDNGQNAGEYIISWILPPALHLPPSEQPLWKVIETHNNQSTVLIDLSRLSPPAVRTIYSIRVEIGQKIQNRLLMYTAYHTILLEEDRLEAAIVTSSLNIASVSVALIPSTSLHLPQRSNPFSICPGDVGVVLDITANPADPLHVGIPIDVAFSLIDERKLLSDRDTFSRTVGSYTIISGEVNRVVIPFSAFKIIYFTILESGLLLETKMKAHISPVLDLHSSRGHESENIPISLSLPLSKPRVVYFMEEYSTKKTHLRPSVLDPRQRIMAFDFPMLVTDGFRISPNFEGFDCIAFFDLAMLTDFSWEVTLYNKEGERFERDESRLQILQKSSILFEIKPTALLTHRIMIVKYRVTIPGYGLLQQDVSVVFRGLPYFVLTNTSSNVQAGTVLMIVFSGLPFQLNRSIEIAFEAVDCEQHAEHIKLACFHFFEILNRKPRILRTNLIGYTLAFYEDETTPPDERLLAVLGIDITDPYRTLPLLNLLSFRLRFRFFDDPVGVYLYDQEDTQPSPVYTVQIGNQLRPSYFYLRYAHLDEYFPDTQAPATSSRYVPREYENARTNMYFFTTPISVSTPLVITKTYSPTSVNRLRVTLVATKMYGNDPTDYKVIYSENIVPCVGSDCSHRVQVGEFFILGDLLPILSTGISGFFIFEEILSPPSEDGHETPFSTISATAIYMFDTRERKLRGLIAHNFDWGATTGEEEILHIEFHPQDDSLHGRSHFGLFLASAEIPEIGIWTNRFAEYFHSHGAISTFSFSPFRYWIYLADPFSLRFPDKSSLDAAIYAAHRFDMARIDHNSGDFASQSLLYSPRLTPNSSSSLFSYSSTFSSNSMMTKDEVSTPLEVGPLQTSPVDSPSGSASFFVPEDFELITMYYTTYGTYGSYFRLLSLLYGVPYRLDNTIQDVVFNFRLYSTTETNDGLKYINKQPGHYSNVTLSFFRTDLLDRFQEPHYRPYAPANFFTRTPHLDPPASTNPSGPAWSFTYHSSSSVTLDPRVEHEFQLSRIILADVVENFDNIFIEMIWKISTSPGRSDRESVLDEDNKKKTELARIWPTGSRSAPKISIPAHTLPFNTDIELSLEVFARSMSMRVDDGMNLETSGASLQRYLFYFSTSSAVKTAINNYLSYVPSPSAFLACDGTNSTTENLKLSFYINQIVETGLRDSKQVNIRPFLSSEYVFALGPEGFVVASQSDKSLRFSKGSEYIHNPPQYDILGGHTLLVSPLDSGWELTSSILHIKQLTLLETMLTVEIPRQVLDKLHVSHGKYFSHFSFSASLQDGPLTYSASTPVSVPLASITQMYMKFSSTLETDPSLPEIHLGADSVLLQHSSRHINVQVLVPTHAPIVLPLSPAAGPFRHIDTQEIVFENCLVLEDLEFQWSLSWLNPGNVSSLETISSPKDSVSHSLFTTLLSSSSILVIPENTIPGDVLVRGILHVFVRGEEDVSLRYTLSMQMAYDVVRDVRLSLTIAKHIVPVNLPRCKEFVELEINAYLDPTSLSLVNSSLAQIYPEKMKIVYPRVVLVNSNLPAVFQQNFDEKINSQLSTMAIQSKQDATAIRIYIPHKIWVDMFDEISFVNEREESLLFSVEFNHSAGRTVWNDFSPTPVNFLLSLSTSLSITYLDQGQLVGTLSKRQVISASEKKLQHTFFAYDSVTQFSTLADQILRFKVLLNRPLCSRTALDEGENQDFWMNWNVLVNEEVNERVSQIIMSKSGVFSFEFDLLSAISSLQSLLQEQPLYHFTLVASMYHWQKLVEKIEISFSIEIPLIALSSAEFVSTVIPSQDLELSESQVISSQKHINSLLQEHLSSRKGYVPTSCESFHIVSSDANISFSSLSSALVNHQHTILTCGAHCSSTILPVTVLDRVGLNIYDLNTLCPIDLQHILWSIDCENAVSSFSQTTTYSRGFQKACERIIHLANLDNVSGPTFEITSLTLSALFSLGYRQLPVSAIYFNVSVPTTFVDIENIITIRTTFIQIHSALHFGPVLTPLSSLPSLAVSPGLNHNIPIFTLSPDAVISNDHCYSLRLHGTSTISDHSSLGMFHSIPVTSNIDSIDGVMECVTANSLSFTATALIYSLGDFDIQDLELVCSTSIPSTLKTSSESLLPSLSSFSIQDMIPCLDLFHSSTSPFTSSIKIVKDPVKAISLMTFHFTKVQQQNPTSPILYHFFMTLRPRTKLVTTASTFSGTILSVLIDDGALMVKEKQTEKDFDLSKLFHLITSQEIYINVPSPVALEQPLSDKSALVHTMDLKADPSFDLPHFSSEHLYTSIQLRSRVRNLLADFLPFTHRNSGFSLVWRYLTTYSPKFIVAPTAIATQYSDNIRELKSDMLYYSTRFQTSPLSSSDENVFKVTYDFIFSLPSSWLVAMDSFFFELRARAGMTSETQYFKFISEVSPVKFSSTKPESLSILIMTLYGQKVARLDVSYPRGVIDSIVSMLDVLRQTSPRISTLDESIYVEIINLLASLGDNTSYTYLEKISSVHVKVISSSLFVRLILSPRPSLGRDAKYARFQHFSRAAVEMSETIVESNFVLRQLHQTSPLSSDVEDWCLIFIRNFPLESTYDTMVTLHEHWLSVVIDELDDSSLTFSAKFSSSELLQQSKLFLDSTRRLLELYTLTFNIYVSLQQPIISLPSSLLSGTRFTNSIRLSNHIISKGIITPWSYRFSTSSFSPSAFEMVKVSSNQDQEVSVLSIISPALAGFLTSLSFTPRQQGLSENDLLYIRTILPAFSLQDLSTNIIYFSSSLVNSTLQTSTSMLDSRQIENGNEVGKISPWNNSFALSSSPSTSPAPSAFSSLDQYEFIIRIPLPPQMANIIALNSTSTPIVKSIMCQSFGDSVPQAHPSLSWEVFEFSSTHVTCATKNSILTGSLSVGFVIATVAPIPPEDPSDEIIVTTKYSLLSTTFFARHKIALVMFLLFIFIFFILALTALLVDFSILYRRVMLEIRAVLLLAYDVNVEHVAVGFKTSVTEILRLFPQTFWNYLCSYQKTRQIHLSPQLDPHHIELLRPMSETVVAAPLFSLREALYRLGDQSILVRIICRPYISSYSSLLSVCYLALIFSWHMMISGLFSRFFYERYVSDESPLYQAIIASIIMISLTTAFEFIVWFIHHEFLPLYHDSMSTILNHTTSNVWMLPTIFPQEYSQNVQKRSMWPMTNSEQCQNLSVTGGFLPSQEANVYEDETVQQNVHVTSIDQPVAWARSRTPQEQKTITKALSALYSLPFHLSIPCENTTIEFTQEDLEYFSKTTTSTIAPLMIEKTTDNSFVTLHTTSGDSKTFVSNSKSKVTRVTYSQCTSSSLKSRSDDSLGFISALRSENGSAISSDSSTNINISRSPNFSTMSTVSKTSSTMSSNQSSKTASKYGHSVSGIVSKNSEGIEMTPSHPIATRQSSSEPKYHASWDLLPLIGVLIQLRPVDEIFYFLQKHVHQVLQQRSLKEKMKLMHLWRLLYLLVVILSLVIVCSLVAAIALQTTIDQHFGGVRHLIVESKWIHLEVLFVLTTVGHFVISSILTMLTSLVIFFLFPGWNSEYYKAVCHLNSVPDVTLATSALEYSSVVTETATRVSEGTKPEIDLAHSTASIITTDPSESDRHEN